MAYVKGIPPGPHAGEMSPLTKVLRPKVGLPETECQRARRLRRRGHGVREIAERLGAKEEQITLAIATMRTKKAEVSRRTLNVTLAAREFVVAEAESGEP